MTVRRIGQIRDELRQAVKRGVRICVFAQAVDSRFMDQQRYHERCEALDMASQTLLSIGVHVNFRDGIHEKVITLDDRILWEGSLNPLSYFDTTERMNRWSDREKVKSAVLKHGLRNCSMCDRTFERRDIGEIFGRLIRWRRKALNMNQVELAKLSGISQSAISRIEKGEVDFRLSTITRLLDRLEMSCRPVPWHLLPSMDQRVLEVFEMETES